MLRRRGRAYCPVRRRGRAYCPVRRCGRAYCPVRRRGRAYCPVRRFSSFVFNLLDSGGRKQPKPTLGWPGCILSNRISATSSWVKGIGSILCFFSPRPNAIS